MTKRISTLHVLALSILITNAGCGIVGDKDRIPMARMGENVITRGDFSMALRKLPPEQKPIIRTKGDVRSALNDYIDDQIKALEAERLEAAGEVDVDPRIAEQRFFAEHPDIMDVRGVTDVNTLPVAITPVELENLKQSIEEGIARTRRELLRENAMRHLVIQAFQTNRFEISEAEWEREYKIQKSGLFHPPRATVKALAIAAVNDEAAAIAAEFRQRVDRGEAFNDVFDEYVADAKGTALETEMVYDPAAPHLRSFWESVNGIAPGSLFGPVTIASQVITVEDALGNPRQSHRFRRTTTKNTRRIKTRHGRVCIVRPRDGRVTPAIRRRNLREKSLLPRC